MTLPTAGTPDCIIGWEMVNAYAETRNTQALVAYPTSLDDCLEIIEYSKNNSMNICPKGGGFSWGDMILNNGHIIADMSKMRKIVEFKAEAEQITVQSGVQLGDIFQKIIPHNLTLPACPGGVKVTVGGAISNNVHGKDSYSAGNFGDQVVSIKILLSSGEMVEIDRKKKRPIFEAVVGGMGLIGIIIEATLQLKKVPSVFVDVTTKKQDNIKESLLYLEEAKKRAEFAVIWSDAFSTGKRLGRGFVKTASWSNKKNKMSMEQLSKSLEVPDKLFGIIPPKPVWYLGRPFLKPQMMRYANMLIHFIQTNTKTANIASTNNMPFMDYNFLFGMKFPFIRQLFLPYGMIEFQPFIPRSAGIEAVEGLLKLFQKFHCEPLFCGIKLHKNDNYMISFAGDGYSVGGAIQVRGRSLKKINQFARAVCEYTMECGGKLLLSKDEMLFRDIFQKMYPRYNEFIGIKKELDPMGLFSSDMYRRMIKPVE